MGRSLIAFLILIFSFQALAVLGERIISIQRVQKSLKSERKIEHHQKTLGPGETVSWTVHEMQANGTTIREYVNKDGIVFAVSWRGLKPPDLSLLLGKYFREFSRSEKKSLQQRKSRSAQTLQTERLVVHRSGHMRDLRGLIYLKELWPHGLTEQDLQ